MTDQTDQGRPSCCCGVCPELVDGGVDCTCRDNPRCPNYQEISMPDQTPTVTAGAIRRAHEWCDLHWPTDENRTPMADVIRHYRATVPAPPATLADEIREADWNGLGDQIIAGRFADRVEAVEKERDEARDMARRFVDEADDLVVERDEARTKVEEVEGHLSKSWRQRDAKDVELERLSREREQQEKALVEHGRLLAEARAAFDEVENRNLNLEADLRESHAEVERLTASLNRQCTTVTPSVHNTDGLTVSSDALPDPADVPTNEPWEVVGPNGPAIGYRDGHEDLPWSVVHKDGNGCDDLSDGRVTLVARLVRRLVGPVEVVEE